MMTQDPRSFNAKRKNFSPNMIEEESPNEDSKQ